MPAPPPPPPPPMPGFGGPGPPPPPPPPGGPPNANTLPSNPPPTISKDRGALLGDITKGRKLKKTETNDRSAPVVDKSLTSSGPSITAPAVPGIGKPSSGLAPPVPSLANRARSNSDDGGGGASVAGVPAAPQLGGIFAGVGMPKLRKTGGGINTGAERVISASDSEPSRPSPPKPGSTASKAPTAPRLNALRPTPQSTNSTPSPPTNPLVANLRKPPPKPAPRPNSEGSFSSKSDLPPRAPPLPPTGAKPPPPPISSRKPSLAPPPPPPPPVVPTLPSAPPPPPTAPPRPPSSNAPTPPPPPPPPPASASRLPPARSTPPPPPPTNQQASSDNISQSVAMQAARNAYGNGVNSPAAQPPPPPKSSPLKQSVAPSNASPALPTNTTSKSFIQTPTRSNLEANPFTLSNGTTSGHSKSSPREHASPSENLVIRFEDSRFSFQDESQFPPPREFMGGPKKYRAGRGSSVPLNLSQFL